MNKKYFRRVIGGYLFLLGIIAIINSIFVYPEIASPFWFCYSALVLIGVGFLLGNSYLILAELNILFIPLIFWNIDFLYKLLTNNSLWGITDYFFTSGFSLADFVTLQHLYILPLAILGLFLFKLRDRKAWSLSLAQVGLIFFLSFFFTSPQKNINCVFRTCFSPISISPPAYYFGWFIAFGLMIFGANYLFYYIFRDKK